MDTIKRKSKKLFNNIRRYQKRVSFCRYLLAGGESLRTDYPLDKNAIVINVGGYIGDFADEITQKFHCRVDVLEPVLRYAEIIGKRFALNSKIHVIQAGLGASERSEVIRRAGLASSIFDVSGEASGDKEKIKIISAIDYFHEEKYTSIDLLEINIEGGEYEVLYSLLEHPDIIGKIRFFQIQFHDFVPEARRMRDEIRKKLSITHRQMWNFPFIWESWEKK